MTNPPNKKRLELTLPDSPAQYANGVAISHTSGRDMVFDFIQMMPGDRKARVVQRIVLTPTNALAFYQAFGRQLQAYEQQYGPIPPPPTPNQGASLADQLFKHASGSTDNDDDQDDSSE